MGCSEKASLIMPSTHSLPTYELYPLPSFNMSVCQRQAQHVVSRWASRGRHHNVELSQGLLSPNDYEIMKRFLFRCVADIETEEAPDPGDI